MNRSPQYDKDFYAWALESAKLLRQGKFKEVDIEHVAEEIESMGNNQKIKLISLLARVIEHLLKYQYKPDLRDRCGNGWMLSIKLHREKVARVLEDNPSLKNHQLIDKLNYAYKQGVLYAAKGLNLTEKIFPKNCPYSIDQCLDDEFFPE